MLTTRIAGGARCDGKPWKLGSGGRAVTAAAGVTALGSATNATGAQGGASRNERAPNFVTTKDGTQLFCRSWGEGRPLVFLSA